MPTQSARCTSLILDHAGLAKETYLPQARNEWAPSYEVEGDGTRKNTAG